MPFLCWIVFVFCVFFPFFSFLSILNLQNLEFHVEHKLHKLAAVDLMLYFSPFFYYLGYICHFHGQLDYPCMITLIPLISGVTEKSLATAAILWRQLFNQPLQPSVQEQSPR